MLAAGGSEPPTLNFFLSDLRAVIGRGPELIIEFVAKHEFNNWIIEFVANTNSIMGLHDEQGAYNKQSCFSRISE